MAQDAARANPSKVQVLDSWEDDVISDESVDDESSQNLATEKGKATTIATGGARKLPVPGPPPPTPVSPRTHTPDWDSQRGSDFREERRRPEKSAAVAGRLIAGALGVKAPKKTEEQRAYERSIKEQEIKRRTREKEQREQEKLEDEKAKANMWDG